MKNYKVFVRTLSVILVIVMTGLLVLYPDIGRSGVSNGLYMSGRVIIPSLFPFAFCVLFIMRSGILAYLKKIEPITRFIFGQSGDEFAVFVLSLIGGYPVGGRLIKELYDTKETNTKRAQILLCYCVNAGPAFTIVAVGGAIFGSRTIGYILLTSSIIASIIMAFIGRFALKRNNSEFQKKAAVTTSIADNFVTSAADAASSVFSICVFVIIFSVINAYMVGFSGGVSFLKHLSNFVEVTSAVSRTKNIYYVSFLLGFSGICVWLQILSAISNIKINLILFAFSRIVHAALSAMITFVCVKIFKPTLNTMTNGTIFSGSRYVSTVSLSVAMLAMVILFCISLFNKKSCGSLLKDVI